MMEYWTDSYGRLELKLSLDQAAKGYHRGACDADIAALMEDQTVSSQLSKLDPEIVRDCLQEYGAWDQEELSNHKENLARLLWIACGDIQERD